MPAPLRSREPAGVLLDGEPATDIRPLLMVVPVLLFEARVACGSTRFMLVGGEPMMREMFHGISKPERPTNEM